jgi:hypothetical protein
MMEYWVWKTHHSIIPLLHHYPHISLIPTSPYTSGVGRDSYLDRKKEVIKDEDEENSIICLLSDID